MVQMRKKLPRANQRWAGGKIIPAIAMDLPFHAARNVIKTWLLHRVMLQFTDNSKAVCQTLMVFLQLADR